MVFFHCYCDVSVCYIPFFCAMCIGNLHLLNRTKKKNVLACCFIISCTCSTLKVTRNRPDVMSAFLSSLCGHLSSIVSISLNHCRCVILFWCLFFSVCLHSFFFFIPRYPVPPFMQRCLHFMLASAPPPPPRLKPAAFRPFSFSTSRSSLRWQLSGDGSLERNADAVRQWRASIC